MIDDTPKRLWILDDSYEWAYEKSKYVDSVQYIRADLVDGLVEAVEKVLRISDRNHDAWYAARAALAALKEEE